MPFGEASVGEGLSLAPATYTLGVAATGDTTPIATFDVPVAAGDARARQPRWCLLRRGVPTVRSRDLGYPMGAAEINAN